MQKETKKQKRRPLGSGLDRTDKELDQLAEISPADLLEAGDLWERDAPAPYKKLLKAKVEEQKGNG